MQWTKDQQKIIDSRNRNLLVAAAAGSGKTAVLVQHVLERVIDPLDPLSMNQLVIVTFTRAAASEMKERLRHKMEEYMEENPLGMNLHYQISLLDQAHICTIDSFCQWLVKNYFHYLDLDPDFRILDEGESRLLREEVLDKVLEEEYRKRDGDFVHFMDAYTSGKGDKEIRNLILRLFFFAESAPWPEEWITMACTSPEDPESLDAYPWAPAMKEDLRQELEQYYELAAMAQQICLQEDWLEKYESMFNSEAHQILGSMDQPTLGEMLDAIASIHFIRKPTISAKVTKDPSLKEALSGLRDLIKEGIKEDLQDKYCLGSQDSMIRHIQNSARDSAELARLTIAFRRAYQKAKKDKNTAEFSDVEHWALDLLMKVEDGHETYTPLADQLCRDFREIIIDEYQDSNLIQEKILTSLSTERFGLPDLFMVGDVKQSIYKFRMAKPELFMDKYHRYKDWEDYAAGQSGCKIDLSMNFRSRCVVLDHTNRLFFQIMGQGLGGIEYDERAALYPGASYPQPEPEAELILNMNPDAEAESPEIEGHCIAEKIRQLMDPAQPLQVWDPSAQSYRELTYRDIVILLRSMDGWAEEITAILNQEGIPAYTQLKKGYFQANEVQVLLNFLKVLDNPRQDIPLASVMHSPIGGFSDQEMAELSAGMDGQDFYERCMQGFDQGRLRDKWQRLLDILERYRNLSIHLDIAEILEMVMDETSYDLILASSPDGDVRMANVEMLMEKARAYEKTMYHGIFHFLRYMEKIQTYEMDFGEAQVLSESENLVRITSIHKSKGLEYPVVFLAGMGKSFNMMDAQNSMLIHEELGIACGDIDTENRTRSMTLTKQKMASRIRRETRGEELRILYVAMTRAREKLICTATVSKRDKLDSYTAIGDMIRRSRMDLDLPPAPLPGILVNQANSYLEWMAMAGMMESTEGWRVHVQDTSALVVRETLRMTEEDMLKEHWLRQGFLPELPETEAQAFARMKEYVYPWQEDIRARTVVSVSELKHASAEQFLAQQEGILLAEKKDRRDDTSEPNMGALRGSAYHLIFEKVPCKVGRDTSSMYDFLQKMVDEGYIRLDIRKRMHVSDFTAFYNSPLGLRMAAAEREGRLYKEQPFVMGLPVREDFLLVQGIIDAFLEEEGELVLWDYKTDRVPEEDPQGYLIGMYQEQLHQYKKALEQSRGQKVKEIWIYSVTLGELIAVPL